MEMSQSGTVASGVLPKTHSLLAVRGFLLDRPPAFRSQENDGNDGGDNDVDEDDEDLSLDLYSGENWMCLTTSAHLLASQNPHLSHPIAPHASIYPLNAASLSSSSSNVAALANNLNPEASSSSNLQGSFLMIDVDNEHCTVKDIRLKPPESRNGGGETDDNDNDDDDKSDAAASNTHYRFSVCRQSRAIQLPSTWDHISFTRRLVHLYSGDRLILWETTDTNVAAVPSLSQICCVWEHNYQATVETGDAEDMMVSQLEVDETQMVIEEDADGVDNDEKNPATSTEQQLLTQPDTSARQQQLLTQPESDNHHETEHSQYDSKDYDNNNDDDDETVDPRDIKKQSTSVKTPEKDSLQGNLRDCVAIASAMKQKTKENTVKEPFESRVETPKVKRSLSTQQNQLRSPALLDDFAPDLEEGAFGETNPPLQSTEFTEDRELFATEDLPSQNSKKTLGASDKIDKKSQSKEHRESGHDVDEMSTETEFSSQKDSKQKDNDGNTFRKSSQSLVSITKGSRDQNLGKSDIDVPLNENNEMVVAKTGLADGASIGEKQTIARNEEVTIDKSVFYEAAKSDDDIAGDLESTAGKIRANVAKMQPISENEDNSRESLVKEKKEKDFSPVEAMHPTQDASLVLKSLADRSECIQAPGEQAHECTDKKLQEGHINEDVARNAGGDASGSPGVKLRIDESSADAHGTEAVREISGADLRECSGRTKRSNKENANGSGTNHDSEVGATRSLGDSRSAPLETNLEDQTDTNDNIEGPAGSRAEHNPGDYHQQLAANSDTAVDTMLAETKEETLRDDTVFADDKAGMTTNGTEAPTRDTGNATMQIRQTTKDTSEVLATSPGHQENRTSTRTKKKDTSGKSSSYQSAKDTQSNSNVPTAQTKRTTRSNRSIGTTSKSSAEELQRNTSASTKQLVVANDSVITTRRQSRVSSSRPKRKEPPSEDQAVPSRRRKTAASKPKSVGDADLSRSSRKQTRKTKERGDSQSGNVAIHLLVTGGDTLTREEKTGIQRLGMTLLDSDEPEDWLKVTHLILEDGVETKRTSKVMIAMSRATKIASTAWLRKCLKEKKILTLDSLVDPNIRQSRDIKKRITAESLERSLEMRSRGDYVLSNCAVSLCKQVAGKKAPSLKELQSMVVAAGGTWLGEGVLEKESNACHTVVITSEPCTRPQERALMNKGDGVVVKTTGWLFDTLMSQNLSLE